MVPIFCYTPIMERKEKPTPAELVANRVTDLTRKVGFIQLQTDQFFEDKIRPEFTEVNEQERLGAMYAHAERLACDSTWLSAMLDADIDPETVLKISEKVDERRRKNRSLKTNSEY